MWEGRGDLADVVTSDLSRRLSTATVLFHHAVAERLGLGPTDHKCLDLLYERGAMTGSELAAITGLTTGAVTGVVARLEKAGHVTREPDPRDGRKQILRPVFDASPEIAEVFGSIRDDAAGLVAGFDDHELATIAEFLSRSIEFSYRRVAIMRAEAISRGKENDHDR
jgi:DNA-binding MarR family transcriptional regulator